MAEEQETGNRLQQGRREKDSASQPAALPLAHSIEPDKSPKEMWRAIKHVVRLQRRAPPIQPVMRGENLPLSFAQERVWWLQQLLPDSPVYNVPVAWHMMGPLDVTILAQSLNEIGQRHEVLRTAFPEIDGQPVQVMAPTSTVSLPVVNLPVLPVTERECEVLRLAAETTELPFDLSQEPLWRAKLLQLDEEEHILILVFHQIVFDGGSMGVVAQEMKALYEAFSAGKNSPLSELPVQYADYAYWQRQWLQEEVQETQLTYWREQQPDRRYRPLQLPIDRPRPPIETSRGTDQSFTLSPRLSQALKAFSQQEGVTLFTTLLAALKALLYNYTGQEDILVFTSTTGRNRLEVKQLIGLFARLLPLRTNLAGNPSFRELLGRVREVAFSAYAHQHLPFEKLVEPLPMERSLDHSSLFQVMLIFENQPGAVPELAGLNLRPLHVSNQTAQFDLFLVMADTEIGLTGWLKYKTELFDAATITRLLAHFQSLLEDVVANPDEPISALLPLALNEASRQFPAPDQTPVTPETAFVAARDEFELQLTQIWEQLLGAHPVGVEDNFFELGGHSLLAVRLFQQIEKVFGRKISPTMLFQAATVGQLAHALRQEERSASWSSLVALQPHGSKPPFFCIHGGGGNVFQYRKLAHYLGPDRPFYGLQPRGMDGKHPFHTRVEAMAAHYIKEIRTLQPQGPYYLGGHCFGGVVAFEMAQQLHEQDHEVGLVALLDAPSPVYDQLMPATGTRVYRHLVMLLRLGPKEKLNYVARRVKRRLNKVRWSVAKKIGRPLPPAVAGALLTETNRQASKANRRALRDYVAQVYPGRLTIFLQPDKDYHAPAIGWEGLAAGGLEIHGVPGEKSVDMLQRDTYVQVLAEKLRACLENSR